MFAKNGNKNVQNKTSGNDKQDRNYHKFKLVVSIYDVQANI